MPEKKKNNAKAPPKQNPGTYPVPEHIKQWFKDNHSKGRGRLPNWWPTPDLTRDLTGLVADGANLVDLASNPDFPPPRTMFGWLARGAIALDEQKVGLKNETHSDICRFAAAVRNARQARLEMDIEQIKVIEHRLMTENQRVESARQDNAGRTYTVPNHKALDVQAGRIVMDSIRWRLAREAPERFADRSKVEHSGTVKVARPIDHAPEWMQEEIKHQAAQEADAKPVPTAPAKDDDKRTVH